MSAAAALTQATGTEQLSAIGLDPVVWGARFSSGMQLLALLHDIGKASSHFQQMIRSPFGHIVQGLRHETISYLLVQRSEFREWLHPVLEDVPSIELVLWAIAGHHLKFPPPDTAPEGASLTIDIHVEHPDFRQTLLLGSDLGLGNPPEFSTKITLNLQQAYNSLFQDRVRAEDAYNRLTLETRRYLAVLKACLICADVAGSIGTRGDESIVDWIPRAFDRKPTSNILKSIAENRLRDGESFRPFQTAVAVHEHMVSFIKAGCGSGKTLAAYLWAAGVAERTETRRRLFLCYPTTGTATEGYRDYLTAPELSAELIHSRSEVDRELAELFQPLPIDACLPQLGSDEPESPRSIDHVVQRPNAASEDTAGALEQWSTPIVCCTVDTVLGLVQNNRRGLFAWPSIAGACCVFDEIHSYDESLFEALLRFLADLPGVPCLLMTASLPEDRLSRIQKLLRERDQPIELVPIAGPVELETVPRYHRLRSEVGQNETEHAWKRVQWALSLGTKVLWVVNSVNAALELADQAAGLGLPSILYHSRYRYEDRVRHHHRLIEAFREPDSPCLAITTQVAEMSLDLSASLLVTELAPVPALIQRLGRLNRRARPDGSTGIRPFIVLEPRSTLPYPQEDLKAARFWLDQQLPARALSQLDLVANWKSEGRAKPRTDGVIWIDGGFISEPRPLRESSPGIDIILRRDVANVKRGTRPERVRIPMPPVPRHLDWRNWEEIGFCPVPPDEVIEYDPERGARWRR